MKKILLVILIVFMCANNSFAVNWCDSAVGCWLFGEGTGTTVADSSPNTNTGNFASDGNPAWAEMTGTNDPDYADYMADFSSDTINCGTDASLDITGTAITVVGWIYLDDVSYVQYQSRSIINRGTFPSGDRKGYQFNQYQGDDLRFSIGIGYNAQRDVQANAVLSTGTWIHVAAVVDGTGAMKLYVNGAEPAYATQNNGASIVSYSGATLYQGHSDFDGKVTELAVFGTALTEEEINDIMNNGLEGLGAGRRAFLIQCGK